MKLTPVIRDRIIMAIKAGNYRQAAAAYAGVGASTFFLWLKKGRDGTGGKKYVELFNLVEQAELEAEATMVLIWRTHMKSDYRAVRDFLERRYPKRWGRRETVTHEGAVPVAEQAGPNILQHVNNPQAVKAYNDFLVSVAEGTRTDARRSGAVS